MRSRRQIGCHACLGGLAALAITFVGLGQGSDQAFIKDAVQGTIAGMRFGALAAQRAENPAVREFAGTLETEHRAALQRATDVAKSLNMRAADGALDRGEGDVRRIRAVVGCAVRRGVCQSHDRGARSRDRELQRQLEQQQRRRRDIRRGHVADAPCAPRDGSSAAERRACALRALSAPLTLC